VKRILVIDDSPLVIEAVRDALEPEGIEVVELDDVTDLDRARVLDDVDLILLDIQMPARFGDVLAGVMRRRGRIAAPILLLSSLPESELDARARAAGLDGYILKERGVDVLVGEVRAWLDGLRQRCGASMER
jgi:DNA-binding response OmpR family regulator